MWKKARERHEIISLLFNSNETFFQFLCFSSRSSMRILQWIKLRCFISGWPNSEVASHYELYGFSARHIFFRRFWCRMSCIFGRFSMQSEKSVKNVYERNFVSSTTVEVFLSSNFVENRKLFMDKKNEYLNVLRGREKNESISCTHSNETRLKHTPMQEKKAHKILSITSLINSLKFFFQACTTRSRWVSFSR